LRRWTRLIWCALRAQPRNCAPTGTARAFLTTIVKLLKEERPLAFFSAITGALIALALVLAFPIFVVYAETGLVPRVPTAIAATGIMILAFLSLASAFILDNVRHGRLETRRLFHLRLPAPSGGGESPIGRDRLD
jgi:hypothetical protein